MGEYLTLLRHNRNYRYLWLGFVVSQIGDWFNLIASANLITQLTDSGAAISYLFLARFLPLFLFSPLAGVLADRFSRRNLLILSDLFRAATVLGFLLVREPEQIWLLYVLTITQFAFSAIFTPARNAVLANIVRREELVTANALDSFSWSTMLAMGSLIGGVVAGLFGIQTAFIMDALTFLLSAWLISHIVVVRPAGQPRPAVRTNSWLDFNDGLRYLRLEPFILVISLVKGAGSLVWGAINVLEVNFAEDVFTMNGNASLTLGIIYFVSGLGTGFGPLLLRRWLGDSFRRMRWAITLGFGLLTLGLWGLALAPTFPIFLSATLVRTIGSGSLWVFSAAMLQSIVPDRVRGRVFAFEFAFLTLTQSISIFWAGFAQDTLAMDIGQVTMSMAVASIFVSLLWLLFHLRTINRPVAPPSGEAMPVESTG